MDVLKVFGGVAAGILLATVSPFDLAVAQQVQVGSTFNSAGPAPRFGPAGAVQSADATPNGTESGAIQTVLTDPSLGAGTIFVGAVNGGVWVTNNGGASWKALTDRQSSLSIASLGLDVTDTTGKTLIAGLGVTSNGDYDQFNTPYQGRGGAQNGLLYSTDGGASWRVLGGSALGNQSVIGVAARGNTILAATFEEQALTTTQTPAGAPYGLYRSTNGGASFSLVSGGAGLPSGAVTSLVADPANPSRFYAAVTSVATPGQAGVYVSNDLGASWTPVFTQASSGGTISSTQQSVLTLAAGPGGAVAIGVSNVATGVVNGVFLSKDGGASWNQLAAPNVVLGGQTPVNFHLAIDPSNANIVYLSGDAYQSCGATPATSFCSITAFRVVFNPSNGTSSSASLTYEGNAAVNFADANTVHADSRAIAFDASGRLILASDGGLYLRSNPQGAGTWQGLNGNLAVFEPYAVVFDANSKRLAIATQDNGVSLQSAPGSTRFDAINGGDGVTVAINDRTLPGLSAIYSGSQNLGGLSRLIINAQGQAVSPDVGNPGGVVVTCNGGNDCGTSVSANFSSPLVLNRIDPTMIAIGGGGGVYVTSDPLTAASVAATSVDLTLSAAGGVSPSTLAYGARDNVHALLAGGTDSSVWLSTAAGTPALARLTNYAGVIPTGVSFDLRTQQRFFVADSQDLWYARNGTAAPASVTFAQLTSSLPAGFIRPTATEFISTNGVNAVLVGGLNAPLTCDATPNGCAISATQSPITVADSDAAGNLGGWRAFGRGLPNALIDALAYNAAADTLAVGAVGRGAWVLFDVTSNFASASVLQFGLANNDSIPDPAILTGARPLIKYGTGTLTITGGASYTGGTTINAGAMVIGNGATSGSILGNVAFCSDAADPACDASTSKVLAFNRADAITFAGSIDGPGQLAQIGHGTLTLSGVSSYTGATQVDAGALIVNGSIASSALTTVNAGALLGGSGTVGNTFVNGGVLAPGNPQAALTVQGNLAFTAAATYLVQLSGALAGQAAVTGSAALNGAGVAVAAVGPSIVNRYTILTATGGLHGTFGGVVSAPAGFTAGLGYDAGHAYLGLGFAPDTTGFSTNQKAVVGALAHAFDAGAAIPAVLGGAGASGLAQASGEPATGAQQNSFQAMTQFLSLLLDPFAEGRGGAAAPDTPLAYAGETTQPRGAREREAYAAMTAKAPLAGAAADPRWNVWAAGFGGSQTTDGNGVTGASATTSRIFGAAVGADYRLSPQTTLGFALTGGGTAFSVGSLGSGRSDLFQAGAFVRHTEGPTYLSAALAYGWQDVTTDRTVTLAGLDRLRATFDANTLSGRVEGGYRFATRWAGITPYAAAQVTSVLLPAYAEQAQAGAGTFALAYGARTATDTRSELGVRADRAVAITGDVIPNGLLTDSLLTLRGRVAWAHDYNPDRTVAATFQALPGASFVVNGAAQAPDAVLTTAAVDLALRNGWSASVSFDGEFSRVTRAYAGKGVVRYAW
ncbi:MAG: autotransporter domain-containing protein [Pseudomonadota bacterium]